MTDNKQHIKNLKKLKSFHNGSYGADIDRAIKALEQEPCEDCISRKRLKECFHKNVVGSKVFDELIDMQPSVNPQESVLDKIRADIMSKDGLEEALEIIDKYRAEGEE